MPTRCACPTYSSRSRGRIRAASGDPGGRSPSGSVSPVKSVALAGFAGERRAFGDGTARVSLRARVSLGEMPAAAEKDCVCGRHALSLVPPTLIENMRRLFAPERQQAVARSVVLTAQRRPCLRAGAAVTR